MAGRVLPRGGEKLNAFRISRTAFIQGFAMLKAFSKCRTGSGLRRRRPVIVLRVDARGLVIIGALAVTARDGPVEGLPPRTAREPEVQPPAFAEIRNVRVVVSRPTVDTARRKRYEKRNGRPRSPLR